MNIKTITKYFLLGGLAFTFMYTYLQTLQLGFDKNDISMTLTGENVDNLIPYYSNFYIHDVPLKISERNKPTQSKIQFDVPEDAYIRTLKLKGNNENNFLLKKVEFCGGNNKIVIKKNEIGRYFHVNDHEYDSKTSTFVKLINKTKDNRFIIYSDDISILIRGLYIKRINPFLIITISIIFALFTVAVFHIISIRKEKLSRIPNFTYILIFLLLLFGIQKKYFSKEIDPISLSDLNLLRIYGSTDSINLVSNGDFRYGLIFWAAMADSTSLDIIETPYGKGVKVTRGDGDEGYWSLRYIGRSILYHKDHTYQIKFKYKIMKGDDIPFNIGWWVLVDEQPVAFRLPLETTILKDNWHEAIAEYTFTEDAGSPACFLNSMKDFSEVYITDVKILDINREKNQRNFLDQ